METAPPLTEAQRWWMQARSLPPSPCWPLIGSPLPTVSPKDRPLSAVPPHPCHSEAKTQAWDGGSPWRCQRLVSRSEPLPGSHSSHFNFASDGNFLSSTESSDDDGCRQASSRNKWTLIICGRKTSGEFKHRASPTNQMLVSRRAQEGGAAPLPLSPVPAQLGGHAAQARDLQRKPLPSPPATPRPGFAAKLGSQSLLCAVGRPSPRNPARSPTTPLSRPPQPGGHGRKACTSGFPGPAARHLEAKARSQPAPSLRAPPAQDGGPGRYASAGGMAGHAQRTFAASLTHQLIRASQRPQRSLRHGGTEQLTLQRPTAEPGRRVWAHRTNLVLPPGPHRSKAQPLLGGPCSTAPDLAQKRSPKEEVAFLGKGRPRGVFQVISKGEPRMSRTRCLPGASARPLQVRRAPWTSQPHPPPTLPRCGVTAVKKAQGAWSLWQPCLSQGLGDPGWPANLPEPAVVSSLKGPHRRAHAGPSPRWQPARADHKAQPPLQAHAGHPWGQHPTPGAGAPPPPATFSPHQSRPPGVALSPPAQAHEPWEPPSSVSPPQPSPPPTLTLRRPQGPLPCCLHPTVTALSDQSLFLPRMRTSCHCDWVNRTRGSKSRLPPVLVWGSVLDLPRVPAGRGSGATRPAQAAGPTGAGPHAKATCTGRGQTHTH